MKRPFLLRQLLFNVTLLIAPCILVGCGQLAYYEQAVSGQVQLLELRRPVEDTLNDPNITPELRQRLNTAHRLRAFASRELLLPDNGSYKSYADLQRDYVVHNVFATPELSLTLQAWCFPVAGCVSYRGYFSAGAAEEFAFDLRQQSLDVYVAGIPAYSTLGWFDDPLLNTFINWSDARLAELLFHELAHQQLYVPNDTIFNESFATAVGQIGAELWLRDNPQSLTRYQQRLDYRKSFIELVETTRSRLAEVYASAQPVAIKRKQKQVMLKQLLREYEQMKQQRWGGYSGYDRWFNEDLNNAKLAALSSYTIYASAFKQLFADSGNDFTTFYAQAETLSKLPKSERNQRLLALRKRP